LVFGEIAQGDELLQELKQKNSFRRRGGERLMAAMDEFGGDNTQLALKNDERTAVCTPCSSTTPLERGRRMPNRPLPTDSELQNCAGQRQSHAAASSCSCTAPASPECCS
jgi:hypothetical protein